MKKLPLIAAAGIGYVLGARAGRERYEQIKSAAMAFWRNPKVQQTVDTVETEAKHAASDVSGKVADAAGDTASKAAHTAGATVSKLSDKIQHKDDDHSDSPPPAPSEGLGDELVGPPPVPGGSVFDDRESSPRKSSTEPGGDVAGDNEGDPPAPGGPFGGK